MKSQMRSPIPVTCIAICFLVVTARCSFSQKRGDDSYNRNLPSRAEFAAFLERMSEEIMHGPESPPRNDIAHEEAIGIMLHVMLHESEIYTNGPGAAHKLIASRPPVTLEF